MHVRSKLAPRANLLIQGRSFDVVFGHQPFGVSTRIRRGSHPLQAWLHACRGTWIAVFQYVARNKCMSNRLNMSLLTLAAVLPACGGASPAVDSMKPSIEKPANPSGAGAASASASVGAGGSTSAETTASSSASGNAGASTSAADEDYGNAFASGDWRGFFWTSAQGAGTTISPQDFSAQMSGMPRCVTGSVGATSDNTGLAILGANLKEDINGKTSVTPTKMGVTLFVMNNAGSPLIFQVEGPDGRWCTYVNEGGGFMPWQKLNSACWNDSGQAYNSEPITAVALLVPSNSTAPVAFDFCLLRLEEADGW